VNNQLRRRVHDVAARIHAVIDTLGDTQKTTATAPTHRRRPGLRLARPDPAPHRPRPATTQPATPHRPNRPN
jgi:hypothetical protein